MLSFLLLILYMLYILQLCIIAYNDNIRTQCMRFAMLEQLKAPSVVFRDAIRAHFQYKRVAILAQLQTWAMKNAKNKPLVQSIEEQLHKLP